MLFVDAARVPPPFRDSHWRLYAPSRAPLKTAYATRFRRVPSQHNHRAVWPSCFFLIPGIPRSLSLPIHLPPPADQIQSSPPSFTLFSFPSLSYLSLPLPPLPFTQSIPFPTAPHSALPPPFPHLSFAVGFAFFLPVCCPLCPSCRRIASPPREPVYPGTSRSERVEKTGRSSKETRTGK